MARMISEESSVTSFVDLTIASGRDVACTVAVRA